MAVVSRRGLIGAASALLMSRPVWAALSPTPRATEGPFYPVRIPDDHDADLIRVESAVREAGGEVLHLAGTVIEPTGKPLAGAVVEIWQCDANGVYLHPRDRRREHRDAAFQGFGRATTDADGRFRFRTILPVPYPGRTPHIHAKFLRDGRELLTTQFYRAGHPKNAADFLFRSMTPEEQERVSMALTPHPGGGRQEWQSEIRVVLPAVL